MTDIVERLREMARYKHDDLSIGAEAADLIETLRARMAETYPKEAREYPAWACFPCGNKYGRGMPEGHVCTIHTGVCGICGDTRAVTEPRDFGHLKPGWDKG